MGRPTVVHASRFQADRFASPALAAALLAMLTLALASRSAASQTQDLGSASSDGEGLVSSSTPSPIDEAARALPSEARAPVKMPESRRGGATYLYFLPGGRSTYHPPPKPAASILPSAPERGADPEIDAHASPLTQTPRRGVPTRHPYLVFQPKLVVASAPVPSGLDGAKAPGAKPAGPSTGFDRASGREPPRSNRTYTPYLIFQPKNKALSAAHPRPKSTANAKSPVRHGPLTATRTPGLAPPAAAAAAPSIVPAPRPRKPRFPAAIRHAEAVRTDRSRPPKTTVRR